MRFLKDFGIGIISYWEAIKTIYERNLWIYFFFPAILSLTIFFGKDELLNQILTFDIQSLSVEGKDKSEFLLLGIQSIAYYIASELSNYVVLIILIPLLTFLSARTEKILTGNRYKYNYSQLKNDMSRAVTITLRNLFRQMLIIALWFFITLFYSPLATYTPAVIFCVGFYYYGFSLIDYTNERRRLNIRDSILFVRKHAGMTIALGAVFSVIFKLPIPIYGQIIGAILAPILGIVAGTIAMHKRVDLSKNKFAIKPINYERFTDQRRIFERSS